MKNKSLRRSLLTSVVSLATCATMFVGTTFAWFTDSVTSSKNVIQSGNLDITLEYWNDTTDKFEEVNTSTALFDDDARWEPGHTEMTYLKISNAGSLALKYQLAVNVYNEVLGKTKDGKDIQLSKYLVFKVVDIAETEVGTYTREMAIDKAGADMGLSSYVSATTPLENKGDSDYVAMIIYMPESVQNEANHDGKNVPSIEMGVKLTATQYTAESDSFDEKYDEGAYLEVVETAAELKSALEAGASVKLGKDIVVDETIEIPESTTTFAMMSSAPSYVKVDLNGKKLDVAFAEGSTTNHIYAISNNGNLVLENGTINTRGIFNYGNLVLENVTINAIDGNGGYGVRNYEGATLTMNSGLIATTYEDDNLVDKGGYDATPVRIDAGATFTMNGGELKNICDFTVAIDNYGTTTINYGKLSSVHSTIANHGTMTVNDGEFVCDGLEGVTAHVVWAAAGTTTINGGSFNGKDNYNGFNVDTSEGAVVNIYGGNFLPVHSGSLYGKGNITVYGGTFADDVTDRVASGYESTQENDVWVVSSAINNSENLKEAISNAQNGSTVVMDKGEFTLPTLSSKEGMTIIGAADGSTVIGGENTSTGFGGNFGKDTTMTNLTFSGSSNGVRSSYANGGETTFNNCVFAGDSTYGFHIDQSKGATFTFNNCTFKGFNAFAGDLKKIIFNNCTFLHNGNYGHTNIWSVAELNNCTFGDKASIGTRGDSAHIFFDGVEESYYHEFIGSAESLVAFQESVAGGDAWKGKKVVLASDIDLAGIEWTPISGFGGTFDGDGYTIANLTVKGTSQVGFFGGVNSTATIKNVTFDNANVSGTHYVAVVLAGEWNEKANATIDNCHVINSTVVCDTDANNDNGDKVGGICGYAVSLNITNCSVKDTTIKAYRDFGGILGCSNGSAVFVSGNTVENVTLVIDNDVNYKNYTTDAEHNANSIVGRMNSGKVENNNVK